MILTFFRYTYLSLNKLLTRSRDLYFERLVIASVVLAVLAAVLVSGEVEGTLARGEAPEGSSYCRSPLVRDFSKPPRVFPQQHPIPVSTALPFGPPNVEFYEAFDLPGRRLLVEGDQFGYRLARLTGGKVRLGWLVTGRLLSVDRNGRPVSRIDDLRKVVRSVGNGAQPLISVEVPGKEGFYRFDLLIQDSVGRRLDSYTEFIRRLPPAVDARMGTQRASYAIGETLRARVENVGTTEVRFGAPFRVERLEGEEWTRVGPARHVWPRYLAFLRAGGTSSCITFRISSQFAPGKYLIGRSVEAGKRGEEVELEIYREFTVAASPDAG